MGAGAKVDRRILVWPIVTSPLTTVTSKGTIQGGLLLRQIALAKSLFDCDGVLSWPGGQR